MTILTQLEIDALVQGAPLGSFEGSEEIAPYNFRRPPRIPRDRQMGLDGIHGNLTLSLQSYLSSRLRQTTDIALAGVELVSWSEFLLSLGDPCASWHFTAGDIGNTAAVVDLDARLVMHLADRLFGGPGHAGGSVRPPTALELQVVRSIVERLLVAWRDAWADHLMLAPVLGEFEANPENLRLLPPDENLLVASLVVRSGIGGGTIAIGVPVPAVESYLQERAAPAARGSHHRAERPAERQLVEHHLRSVRIPVAARLPEFRLSAMDVANFQVGQILETGQQPNGMVELLVNGRNLFLGTLGRQQGAVGLRVVDRADRHPASRSQQRRKVIP